MKVELIEKIREEVGKEIACLDEYNTYARLRNKLATIEEVNKMLGLPYNGNLVLPEKTESEVIMSIYKKYAKEIEEEDTNNIYCYIATYMTNEVSTEQMNGEFPPFEIEVEANDPRATHKYYLNLEGFWSKTINIEDSIKFENNHTVLHANNFYDLQKEFIIAAIKEGQEKAISKVLKKYK